MSGSRKILSRRIAFAGMIDRKFDNTRSQFEVWKKMRVSSDCKVVGWSSLSFIGGRTQQVDSDGFRREDVLNFFEITFWRL
mmetsp:Transcript_32788/g.51247  ORF Transcript_32788/g.51247 Transcript_32788/m.51247 type:complete len:81 (-) Transcript_32788:273-515(-)